MTKTIQETIDETAPGRTAAKAAIMKLIEGNKLVLNPDPNYGVIFEGLTVNRWMPWARWAEGYNTALSPDRFHMIMQLEDYAPVGPAVEMGVFTGGVTRFLLDVGREVFAFDTFEGIVGASDKDDYHVDGEYNGGDVMDYIKGAYVIKGVIPASFDAPLAMPENIALAHIDLDVKAPTTAALEFVYERLHPQGVIIVDDYGFASTPGVKEAVDEFAKGRKLYIPTGQMLIWKMD